MARTYSIVKVTHRFIWMSVLASGSERIEKIVFSSFFLFVIKGVLMASFTTHKLIFTI